MDSKIDISEFREHKLFIFFPNFENFPKMCHFLSIHFLISHCTYTSPSLILFCCSSLLLESLISVYPHYSKNNTKELKVYKYSVFSVLWPCFLLFFEKLNQCFFSIKRRQMRTRFFMEKNDFINFIIS